MTPLEQKDKLILLSHLEFAFEQAGRRGESLAGQIDKLRHELEEWDVDLDDYDDGEEEEWQMNY